VKIGGRIRKVIVNMYISLFGTKCMKYFRGALLAEKVTVSENHHFLMKN
jgi:hypothetical protein